MSRWSIELNNEELEIVRRLVKQYLEAISGTQFDYELKEYIRKILALKAKIADPAFKGE